VSTPYTRPRIDSIREERTPQRALYVCHGRRWYTSPVYALQEPHEWKWWYTGGDARCASIALIAKREHGRPFRRPPEPACMIVQQQALLMHRRSAAGLFPW
jgi:hypothetical protein